MEAIIVRKTALFFGMFFSILLFANMVPLSSSEQISNNVSFLTSLDGFQVSKISTPQSPAPPPLETVAIIVQNTLYSSISGNVTQYRADLNNTGYNTLLVTQLFNTHQELRGNLTQWYHSYTNFVGAVIIGRLPFAQFYHPTSGQFTAETFIADLYLMDLDGNWYDTGMAGHAVGVYDVHNASAGADIYPEIFIGRIDPQNLSWDTPANFINTYLDRVHRYRTGGVQRQKRALVYIDDDWAGYWGSVWDGEVGLAYSTRTFIDSPATWTNSTDWANNRLIQNYQWTHLAVHSSATAHWFGPGGFGGEGIISANPTIRQAPPSFNFYNLFACHGSQWTTTDSLGSTYTFSGNYSLATIGSTKTGGMMDNNHFYNPISVNDTIGEALQYWFANSLNTSSTAGSQFLEWYYGMNIIGDPFLTINYDSTALPPTIMSSTHPDPSVWSTNNQPQFNWTVPIDVNGIAGYYYIIDQNSSTIPSAITGTYTLTNGTQSSILLADGTYYLHVVSRDNVGNVGKIAAHYQVNIDVTNPVVTITMPSTGATVTTSVLLSWSVVESGSGYDYARIHVNGLFDSQVNTPLTNSTLILLNTGSVTINVTVFDQSGLSGSDQITVIVSLPPLGIPGFPIEAIAIGAVLALGLGVIYRRKKR